MKPKLILSGPIGCGKSTMIRMSLRADAVRAGGYVTLRQLAQSQLLVFSLAPARALADPTAMEHAQTFLDFTQGTLCRNPAVFSGLGVQLLQEALDSPFAVADEFGGVELLLPDFSRALQNLLFQDVPCIGVLKNQEASTALIQRMRLGDDYRIAYHTLREQLESDPNTEILETTGRYDERAWNEVARWVQCYVRK